MSLDGLKQKLQELQANPPKILLINAHGSYSRLAIRSPDPQLNKTQKIPLDEICDSLLSMHEKGLVAVGFLACKVGRPRLSKIQELVALAPNLLVFGFGTNSHTDDYLKFLIPYAFGLVVLDQVKAIDISVSRKFLAFYREKKVEELDSRISCSYSLQID